MQKILPTKQLKKIQTQYDKTIAARFSAWNRLMRNSRSQPVEQKLRLVNDFFNQMKWTEDRNLWQQRDYWATPIESLIQNAGDCEDFSIAKYFTLLELGVPMEQLKVSYVQIKPSKQAHMVLTYYQENTPDPLILDNMNSDILPASQRQDLAPVFHFNNESIWQQGSPNQPMGPAHKIDRWADLMSRLEAEQI